MDYKAVPRLRAGILAGLLLFLAAQLLPVLVQAQAGICPDDTQQIITPLGWGPGDMSVCVDSNDWQIIYESYFPCGSVLRNFQGVLPNQLGYQPVTLVYPADMAFPSGYAKFGFYFTSLYTWGYPAADQSVISVKSFDENNFQVGEVFIDAGDYPSINITNPGALYSEFVAVRDVIVRAEEAGYMTVEMVEPGYLTVNDFAFAGFIIVDAQQPLPDLCSVAGTPVPTPTATPVTNTPTAQPTPTGTIPNTWTPTYTLTPSTTPQSYPTSPGGTPSPFPTSTPYQLSTRRAEPTGTPLTINTIPALVVPTLDFPSGGGFSTPEGVGAGLTPNSTTEARITAVAEYQESAGVVVTAWAENNALASSYFAITETVGISTPLEMATEMSAMITEPISWARIIEEYAPNLWVSVFWILVLFAWVTWILVAKFGFTVILTIINWIYKIIELIPGF